MGAVIVSKMRPWLARWLAPERRPHLAEWTLRIAAAACFLGRAWQHLRWDAPFRAVLWHQSLMEGAVERLLGMTWQEYATSLEVDQAIQASIRAFGVLYLLCVIPCLTVRAGRRWQAILLLIGSAGLIKLTLLTWQDKMGHFAQLIEYSCQWGAPLLLLAVLKWGATNRWIQHGAAVAIVFTFLGHGLYAIGYYDTPGHFSEMVMAGLGLSEDNALILLRLAGVLDIVVCVLIFIPRVRQPALAYAAAWGFLTAIARVWTGFSWDFPVSSFSQWSFETLVRLPHAAVPLFLILALGLSAATARDTPSEERADLVHS